MAWAACAAWFGFRLAAPGWEAALVSAAAALGAAEPFALRPAVAAAAGHLAGMGAFAAVLAALFGAGAPVARVVLPPMPKASFMPAALACGFVAFALLQHGLGLAGLWFRPVIAAAVGGAVVAGWRTIRRIRPRPRWRMPTPRAALPLGVGGFGLFAAWLLTRLPDTHEDARTYHFAAPEQWLALHRIVADPQHFPWHLPLAAEMSYAAAWSLGGIAAAKLVNLAAVLVTALVLPRLVDLAGWSRSPAAAARAAAWGRAAWLCAGGVTAFCWEGKNDLVLVMFVTLALWAGGEAVRGRARWWRAAAWWLGAATAVKYTTVFFAAGVAAATVGMHGGFRRTLRPLRALPLALIPVAGWWAADWIWLGNPAHPFLAGIFPEPAWNAGLERAMHENVLGFAPPGTQSRLDWFSAAFRVLADARFGTPLLAIALPALIALPRRAGARWLGAALASAYLCWLPTERMGRYLLPLLPSLLSLAAAGTEPRLAASRLLRGAAAALLLGTAALNALSAAAPTGFLFLAGQMDRAAFLRERFTTWEAVRVWTNARLPRRARLLFTGEERRLWFVPRVVSYAGVSEPVFWRVTRESRTAAEARKKMRQRGLTHHLHNFVSAQFREMHWYTWTWRHWDRRQLAVYREFVARYERPVYRPPAVDYANGGFYVFEFSRDPAPAAAPVYFLPHTEGLLRPALERARARDLAGCEREARRAGRILAGVIQGQQDLGFYFTQLDRNADAVAVMRPGIEAGFMGESNCETYAESLARLGRYDEAIHALCRGWRVARKAQTGPNLAVMLYLRARDQRLPRHEYAAVLRDLELAALLRPGEAPPWSLAAVTLERMGRSREAVAYARRCLALAPQDPAARALLSRHPEARDRR